MNKRQNVNRNELIFLFYLITLHGLRVYLPWVIACVVVEPYQLFNYIIAFLEESAGTLDFTNPISCSILLYFPIGISWKA